MHAYGAGKLCRVQGRVGVQPKPKSAFEAVRETA